ncbi:hypothetical protein OT109_04320 [Phycisphaeraceae bacterium D3-23]
MHPLRRWTCLPLALYALAVGCAATPGPPAQQLPVTASPDGQLRLAAPMGHAHNDYVSPDPLHAALDAGMLSIEADVFLVDATLYVAHDQEDITPDRTLQALYLDPLWQRFQERGGAQPDHLFGGAVRDSGVPLVLMVDLKDDGLNAWLALETLLAQYPGLARHVQHPEHLAGQCAGDFRLPLPSRGRAGVGVASPTHSTITRKPQHPTLPLAPSLRARRGSQGSRHIHLKNAPNPNPPAGPPTLTPGPVLVVVSGDRPIAAITHAPARYCGYDGRWPSDADSNAPAHLMPMVSMSAQTLLDLAQPTDDPEHTIHTTLHALSHHATTHGRLARIWATPDHPNTWHQLHTAGLQLINTDTPGELAEWLNNPTEHEAPAIPHNPH